MLETILFLSACILKQLKMVETVYCFWVLKSELKECMYFETEHCRAAAAAVTAVVTGCCRDTLSYTVSE